MHWRMIFGWVTTAGVVLLLWDLATIGSKETRRAVDPTAHGTASAVA
jgi:nitric oxide reductase subunit B